MKYSFPTGRPPIAYGMCSDKNGIKLGMSRSGSDPPGNPSTQ
jgi:hypothetical protein